LSIRVTLAPKSARILPHNGPGARPTNSKTFMPFKGIWRIDQVKAEKCTLANTMISSVNSKYALYYSAVDTVVNLLF